MSQVQKNTAPKGMGASARVAAVRAQLRSVKDKTAARAKEAEEALKRKEAEEAEAEAAAKALAAPAVFSHHVTSGPRPPRFHK
jgi:hypothetical protein